MHFYPRYCRALLIACCLLILLPIISRAQSPTRLLLPTTSLVLHTATGTSAQAQVEIAATPQSRNLGLMFRESLLPNHGMLFVFDTHAGCFWMRNTLIPLSIAFIDAHGTITHLADMQPLSDTEHCPPQASKYALEMTQGWFKAKGLQRGDMVSGLPQ